MAAALAASLGVDVHRAGQGVQGIVMLVQVAFSRLGTDLASPTSDSIAESSVTVSMWLYVGLVAPICEEVLFRGVLMKELKPLGKNFAIVTSAMVFGLFHDDVVQGTFAFLFGLILGFVAMEYSLVWSNCTSHLQQCDSFRRHRYPCRQLS